MELSDTVVNAMADAGFGLADGGTLEIREGATVLAVLGFASPAFGAPAGGRIAARALTPEPSAPATGTANNYRVLNASGSLLWTGSVGAPGSGCDMEGAALQIQRGSRVELPSGPTMTVPKR